MPSPVTMPSSPLKSCVHRRDRPRRSSRTPLQVEVEQGAPGAEGASSARRLHLAVAAAGAVVDAPVPG